MHPAHSNPELHLSSSSRVQWLGWQQSGGATTYSFPSPGAQAAADMTILLPSLKGSCLNHPVHQGLPHLTRHLRNPTSAPRWSKKPRMQAAGDMFPTDWSPPPVEFLNMGSPQASRMASAQGWIGRAGPQGPRRLALQLPKYLEQQPQDSEPKRGLASLKEPFWNTPGPS